MWLNETLADGDAVIATALDFQLAAKGELSFRSIPAGLCRDVGGRAVTLHQLKEQMRVRWVSKQWRASAYLGVGSQGRAGDQTMGPMAGA